MKLLNYILFLCLVPVFVGCSGVSAYVESYCEKPQAERQVIRDSVRLTVAPHVVKIECAGDGDNE